MLTLTGKHICLRALELEDLEFIHQVENNETFWEISATQTPYSKFVLKQYLENAHRDIYEVKQLRLAITTNKDKNIIGLIDIFDFDPKNRRAGIGILIADKKNREKGVGTEALQLLCNYCFTHLDLHQVYANVPEQNTPSRQLFEKNEFTIIGIKKDWNYKQGIYNNEILYQRINVH